MNTIDCPWCEHEHDAVGSYEDDHGEQECDSCGKWFFVEIEYSPEYLTHKIDKQ